MLESALCREPVEKPALERTALQMNLDSLLRKSLRKEESLPIEGSILHSDARRGLESFSLQLRSFDSDSFQESA